MPTFVKSRTRSRTLEIGFAGALVLAANLANGLAMDASPDTAAPSTNLNARAAAAPAAAADATTNASMAEKWGIEPSGLFLSGGGNMVDFRYRVIDSAKAAFLTDAKTKPTLVDPATGAKLIVPDTPKVGQLRQITAHPVVGKLYFILFANTRHHVKSGDKVSIVAGDFKLENLTVE